MELPSQARKRKRTSAFRGVTKAGRKWRAALRVNNAKKELGTFDDELEAARRAPDQAALLTSDPILAWPPHATMFEGDRVYCCSA